MKFKFEWVIRRGAFASGERLLLNGVCLAVVSYNACRSAGETKKTYMAQIFLPSLEEGVKSMYGENEEELKNRVEGVVTRWLQTVLQGVVS